MDPALLQAREPSTEAQNAGRHSTEGVHDLMQTFRTLAMANCRNGHEGNPEAPLAADAPCIRQTGTPRAHTSATIADISLAPRGAVIMLTNASTACGCRAAAQMRATSSSSTAPPWMYTWLSSLRTLLGAAMRAKMRRLIASEMYGGKGTVPEAGRARLLNTVQNGVAFSSASPFTSCKPSA